MYHRMHPPLVLAPSNCLIYMYLCIEPVVTFLAWIPRAANFTTVVPPPFAFVLSG